MAQHAHIGPGFSELVWIDCLYPVVALGLKRALETRARVYVGREAPQEKPSSVIYCTQGEEEDVHEGIRRIKEASPGVSILVFGLHVDLSLAQAALRIGARGFIHAGMTPDQIARAVTVASKGEIVAPRQLLEHLLAQEDPVDLNILTSRQQEILELVVDGMSNAQIAKQLYLSESTVKQHLRAAYKVLGVNNRTEAAKLVRDGS